MSFEKPNLQKQEKEPKTDSYLEEINALTSQGKFKEFKKGMEWAKTDYNEAQYKAGRLDELHPSSPDMKIGTHARLASNELSEIEKYIDSNEINATGVVNSLKRALKTLEGAGVANRPSVKKRVLRIAKSYPDNAVIEVAREFYKRNPESEENKSDE